MKTHRLIVAVALALTGAWSAAQAPATLPSESPTAPTPAMPSAAMPQAPAPAQAAPEPIVVETMIDLTTEPGPPADRQAARQEAVNALHWARTEGCRSEPDPRECLRQAREDYRAALDRLEGQGNEAPGAMSASGTSGTSGRREGGRR